MCRVILIRAAHQIIIVNWETEKRYWSMHELERKSRNWLSSADDDQEQWSSDQWSLRALSIIARSESQVSGCRAAGDGLMLAQCLMSWEWSVLDHQSPGPDTLVLSVEDISVINKCQHQATISRTFQLSIKVSADFITILFIRTCYCGSKKNYDENFAGFSNFAGKNIRKDFKFFAGCCHFKMNKTWRCVQMSYNISKFVEVVKS